MIGEKGIVQDGGVNDANFRLQHAGTRSERLDRTVSNHSIAASSAVNHNSAKTPPNLDVGFLTLNTNPISIAYVV